MPHRNEAEFRLLAEPGHYSMQTSLLGEFGESSNHCSTAQYRTVCMVVRTRPLVRIRLCNCVLAESVVHPLVRELAFSTLACIRARECERGPECISACVYAHVNVYMCMCVCRCMHTRTTRARAARMRARARAHTGSAHNHTPRAHTHTPRGDVSREAPPCPCPLLPIKSAAAVCPE